jgi:hypothetical protein
MDQSVKIQHFHETGVYRICVRGVLSDKWRDYVQGMTVFMERDKEYKYVTTLEGELVDQAALLGVLNVLHDLRLSVLSVEYLP